MKVESQQRARRSRAMLILLSIGTSYWLSTAAYVAAYVNVDFLFGIQFFRRLDDDS
jgi:hypothetical protein